MILGSLGDLEDIALGASGNRFCNKSCTAKKVFDSKKSRWTVNAGMDWGYSGPGIQKLEETKIVVMDQDQILALTMGLSSFYDTIIINFDVTPADQLTLEHIITQLLNEVT